MKPTRKAEWAKVGDKVTHVNGNMCGVVTLIRKLTSATTATVKWENGFVGRHTLAALRKVGDVGEASTVRNYCRGQYAGGGAGLGAHWYRANNYGLCLTCGKRVRITKSGRLRAHWTVTTDTKGLHK